MYVSGATGRGFSTYFPSNHIGNVCIRSQLKIIRGPFLLLTVKSIFSLLKTPTCKPPICLSIEPKLRSCDNRARFHVRILSNFPLLLDGGVFGVCLDIPCKLLRFAIAGGRTIMILMVRANYWELSSEHMVITDLRLASNCHRISHASEESIL